MKALRCFSKAAIFLIFVVSIVLPSIAYTSTITVKKDGTGDYLTIQEGIDVAVPGDIVLVSDGTYNERIDFLGKAITVQSENGAQVTTIDGTGLTGSIVTFVNSETSASLLEGFTITGCTSASLGGGIYCSGASPAINNCTISGNSIAGLGAGVACDTNSEATFTNCTISDNSVTLSGGGVYFSYASPNFIDCTISGNSASANAGGVFCNVYSSPTFTGTTISDNTCVKDGGAMFCRIGSTLVMTDCTVSGNSSSALSLVSSIATLTDCTISNNLGGGIIFDDSPSTLNGCTLISNLGSGASFVGSPSTVTNCTVTENLHTSLYFYNSPSTITNCTVHNNSGSGVGFNSSPSTLTNCTISDNSDGGIWFDLSNTTLTNCTISGNYDSYMGGGLNVYLCTITCVNTILWGNSAEHGGDEARIWNNATLNLDYSVYAPNGFDIDETSTMNITNSMTDDPLFIDAFGGDYHITPDSPCIDSATATGAPADDIDGDSRPLQLGYDIGSDEGKWTFYVDADNDGYGDPADTGVISDVDLGAGYSIYNTDCNETDASINPGAPEVNGDGIDQNCNGYDLVTYYPDSDGDDYGNPLAPLDVDGPQPAGYLIDGTDCDDLDASIYPGAPEIPDDGIDQNCNGYDLITYFLDEDSDDYGIDSSTTQVDGPLPVGYSLYSTDCDDSDASIYPGAPEISNDGIDQNCNGYDLVTCYQDSDSDGYGDSAVTQEVDSPPPSGYLIDGTDCDDSDASIYPGAPEVPNDGIDQNCNGYDLRVYYADSDGDGYGDASMITVNDGLEPAGYVTDNTDCDDSDAAVYPGAPEIREDGIDQDCDGYDLMTYYADSDGDGYGDPSSMYFLDGAQPAGYVTDSTDCDDTDASINPGSKEVPGDGIDQNCDGSDSAPTVEASGGGGGGGGCFIATASYEDTRNLTIINRIIDRILEFF